MHMHMHCIVQHSRTLQHTLAGILGKIIGFTQRAQDPTKGHHMQ